MIPSKKYFQNLIWLSFCPLHYYKYTSCTYCKYILCSLRLRGSIGSNYTIAGHSENTLLQEKAHFIVLSKSRVDKRESREES